MTFLKVFVQMHQISALTQFACVLCSPAAFACSLVEPAAFESCVVVSVIE